MEHLWSTAGAPGGNQSQVEGPKNASNARKSVAVGCDRLPPGPHGKEGVDGSSPSEGSAKAPEVGASCVHEALFDVECA
jgi:hypothetical protein